MKVEIQFGDDTWYEVITSILTSDEFAQNFHDTILSTASSHHWKAIYWECIPVSKKTWKSIPFTMAILPAYELYNTHPSSKAYQSYFSVTEDPYISFINLSGTTKLIVPTPSEGSKDPTHLLSFLKTCTDPIGWWRYVMSTLQDDILSTTDTRWVNTHGLGVPWLHVRFDSYPKYYRSNLK